MTAGGGEKCEGGRKYRGGEELSTGKEEELNLRELGLKYVHV